MNNTTKKLRFPLDPATGTLSAEDTRTYFSRIGFATAALVAINIGVQLLLSFLIFNLAPALYDNAIVQNIASLISLYLAALPVFLYILRPLPSVSPLRTPMSGKQWIGGLCASVAVMTVGSYVSQSVVLWFDLFMNRSLENPVEAATVGTAWWVNLIFVALLAPILEEILFRKLLCRYLLPLGEGYAIVLSAAIFGLAHGNFFQFFYAFGLGCVFALIYIKTGKLIYTILYHMIINLLGGVLAPWVIEKLDAETLVPLLEELMASTEPDLSLLAPYALPLAILSVYEIFMYVAAIAGAIMLFRAKKKYSLDAGLLPPPRKGRIGNVFLNTGVAAALTVFAVIFLVSLLP